MKYCIIFVIRLLQFWVMYTPIEKGRDRITSIIIWLDDCLESGTKYVLLLGMAVVSTWKRGTPISNGDTRIWRF